MELIEKQPETTEMGEAEDISSADTEPQDAERYTAVHEHNWLLYAILALVAAGIIVGLIFLARWIYHLTKSSTPSHRPTTSQTQNNGGSSTSGAHSTGNSSQSGSTSATTNGQTGKPGTQPLPNNGPGNVIGIFAAASFAAGSLHYIISLRKAARPN